jgi:hypothetical protein
MLEISCVINVDTRPENSQNREMFNGVVDRDFLVDGIYNKVKLFDGFEKEIIVFVDEHEPIEEKTLNAMRKMCNTLIIRKHDKKFEDNDNFFAFNDFNYINALTQARGKYIFHFDGDVSAFTIDQEPIKEIINKLEEVSFVSYPSLWSPNPVEDPSFNGHYWVSTRFFACKRSTLDFTEIIKCQLDYDYWKEKYPRARLCHWLEHLLCKHPNDVYYPPLQFDRFILYTWENYDKYLLQRLNNQTFEEVNNWVCSKSFHYPNNLSI